MANCVLSVLNKENDDDDDDENVRDRLVEIEWHFQHNKSVSCFIVFFNS